MPITITCPNCGSKLKTPDNLAGRTVKCPKCSTALTVPNAESSHEDSLLVVADPDNQFPGTPPRQAAASAKDCPFCGEQVLATAKKCKHCGETIDSALRVAEEARRMADKQNPMVFMNAGGGGASASSSSGGNGPSVIIVKNAFPHMLHLILTILTVGLWAPIWIIHYLISGR